MLPGDTNRRSPNFYADRFGVKISGVTMHSTRGGPKFIGKPEAEFNAALGWLTRFSYVAGESTEQLNPSIQYVVGHNGRLTTFGDSTYIGTQCDGTARAGVATPRRCRRKSP